MLKSEQIERERRFKLALRAGLPILILSGLIGYNMVFKPTLFDTIITNIYLLLAILFIGIYFIYFMIEIASSETILDETTKLFTEQAFIKQLGKFKPYFITLFVVDNIDIIEEQNGIVIRESVIASLASKINQFAQDTFSQSYIIARVKNGEIVIAAKSNSKIDISKHIKNFINKNSKINNIEIEYSSATTEYIESYDKTYTNLKILIQIPKTHTTEEKIKDKNLNIDIIDIDAISKNSIKALEDKNLLFTFRPLMNLKDKQIEIYEVYSKLKANDSSEILPKIYLPILNRLGLSRQYDIAISQKAINLLASIDTKISLIFNISPFSIRDSDFQKQFIKMLRASKIDPSRAIIQLYENKSHHDISSYLKILQLYKKEGIRISIDNFGLSSTEYMKHFKFDMIQLDRDFIIDIGKNDSKTMLNAILDIAKSNGITTVAKWVDKPEQKDTLKELGIDYIQGYMVHKPLFESEIITKYETDGDKK